MWKVEHKCAANESLLIGYEYTYDLLGRVVQSVERHPDNPGTDTTVYTYTPAGRLESEVREGQVAYSRYYGYNLDGSRAMVMRDDALNGTHWDMYGYDSASGRLASVQDAWTGEVHSFVWNPEGTLARWSSNAPNSYARVFGYDEEGRLVKIERDYGSGGAQVAYEYGYSSDGARVWKRDVLNGQEYRYVCRIGCGGVPMRVYNRPMSGGSWASVEDYLEAGRLLAYDSKIRIDLEDSEIYYQEKLSFLNVPVDTYGHRMLRAVPCIAVQFSVSNLDFCTPDIDECIDIPDDSAILTRLGQRPCPPRPRCGYVYSGLECRTIQDIPIPGMRCGPWSRWAKVFNFMGWTEVWCRSRICNRDRSVTQQCRVIWKKNRPPYDTRYGPWRRRICIITETNKQYNCCPGQQSDPNRVGCSSPGETFFFFGQWIPGSSNCSWQ